MVSANYSHDSYMRKLMSVSPWIANLQALVKPSFDANLPLELLNPYRIHGATSVTLNSPQRVIDY